jgi:hypothetical protein
MIQYPQSFSMVRRIGLRAFPRRREAEDAGGTSPHSALIPVDNLILRSSATKRATRGQQVLKTYFMSFGLLLGKLRAPIMPVNVSAGVPTSSVSATANVVPGSRFKKKGRAPGLRRRTALQHS